MTILPQSFFAFVGCHFMAFPFFSAWHNDYLLFIFLGFIPFGSKLTAKFAIFFYFFKFKNRLFDSTLILLTKILLKSRL